jgi:hypothetical protein
MCLKRKKEKKMFKKTREEGRRDIVEPPGAVYVYSSGCPFSLLLM